MFGGQTFFEKSTQDCPFFLRIDGKIELYLTATLVPFIEVVFVLFIVFAWV